MKSQSCILILAVVALFSVSKAHTPSMSPQVNNISETSNPTEPTNVFTTSLSMIANDTEPEPDNTTSGSHTDPVNTVNTINPVNTVNTINPINKETPVKKHTTTASETLETNSVTEGTPSAPSGIPALKTDSWWGYLLLVLIFGLIIALCVILFFLRRVSRTYSFDLHRPCPSRMNEPIGSFEPVYVDDLDYQIDTVEFSTLTATNGSAISPKEKEPNGEAPQDEPLPNGQQTPLTPDPSPTAQTEPDQDPPDQSSSPDVFLDAAREDQQNENNNNPSVCSSDPFVEINLEEPQWQLFTSQQSPSSVLPYSPFCFDSSSSSSSSSSS